MGELVIDTNDLKKLIRDVEIIKNLLLSEGEVTDWAREKLAEARATPDSECISLEEVEKKILENV